MDEEKGENVKRAHDDGNLRNARALPCLFQELPCQTVHGVCRRENQREDKELEKGNRSVVCHVIPEHLERRSILVRVDDSKGKMASEKPLDFVVEKREQENDGVEYRIQRKPQRFERNPFRGPTTGEPCPDDSRQGEDKQKNDERIANPDEIDANRMEDIPVGLADKGKSVRVLAEKQQNAQKDVRNPEGERNGEPAGERCMPE